MNTVLDFNDEWIESEDLENYTTSTFDDSVPVKAKLGFSAVNTSNIILSGLGLGSIDIFYLKFYNLDPRLIAISWILFMVWNAVNDPLIGIIQDKTKSKLGRRVPYLRYGALLGGFLDGAIYL